MNSSSLGIASIGAGLRSASHSQALANLGLTRRVVCDARATVAEALKSLELTLAAAESAEAGGKTVNL